jgi:hypothetical protein
LPLLLYEQSERRVRVLGGVSMRVNLRVSGCDDRVVDRRERIQVIMRRVRVMVRVRVRVRVRH